MADIKINDETLLRMGRGIGYAFAPLFRGVLEGVEDYAIEQAALDLQKEHDAHKESEQSAKKTRIDDCRKCWCDQCAKLDRCEHLREGTAADENRPLPCAGCGNGMRFQPCEEERCADFVQGAGYNNG